MLRNFLYIFLNFLRRPGRTVSKLEVLIKAHWMKWKLARSLDFVWRKPSQAETPAGKRAAEFLLQGESLPQRPGV